MEKLTAIYEHTEDGWWVVSVPEIPGAHSQGRTLQEAREMIKDARAGCSSRCVAMMPSTRRAQLAKRWFANRWRCELCPIG